MQPWYVSQNATGSSAWRMLNPDVTPFNVGIGVIATQPVTYSVQYTYDDPNTGLVGAVYPNPNGTATAFNLSTLNAVTGTLDSSITFPVMAIRINKLAGTGSAAMTVVQAGICGP